MVEATSRSTLTAWIVATVVSVGIQSLLLAADVKVSFDKAFDFKAVKTWAWRPEGPGEVKMARTPSDDPEAMRKQAEPLIVSAVEAEMAKRGMQLATSSPDLVLTYYLLLTTSASAQTIGQFIPPVTDWGIPPFTPSTQSLEMMNQGSLVLDFNTKNDLVWRGVAQGKIKIGIDNKRREELLRDAVRDIVRRFPPKS